MAAERSLSQDALVEHIIRQLGSSVPPSALPLSLEVAADLWRKVISDLPEGRLRESLLGDVDKHAKTLVDRVVPTTHEQRHEELAQRRLEQQKSLDAEWKFNTTHERAIKQSVRSFEQLQKEAAHNPKRRDALLAYYEKFLLSSNASGLLLPQFLEAELGFGSPFWGETKNIGTGRNFTVDLARIFREFVKQLELATFAATTPQEVVPCMQVFQRYFRQTFQLLRTRTDVHDDALLSIMQTTVSFLAMMNNRKVVGQMARLKLAQKHATFSAPVRMKALPRGPGKRGNAKLFRKYKNSQKKNAQKWNAAAKKEEKMKMNQRNKKNNGEIFSWNDFSELVATILVDYMRIFALLSSEMAIGRFFGARMTIVPLLCHNVQSQLVVLLKLIDLVSTEYSPFADLFTDVKSEKGDEKVKGLKVSVKTEKKKKKKKKNKNKETEGDDNDDDGDEEGDGKGKKDRSEEGFKLQLVVYHFLYHFFVKDDKLFDGLFTSLHDPGTYLRFLLACKRALEFWTQRRQKSLLSKNNNNINNNRNNNEMSTGLDHRPKGEEAKMSDEVMRVWSRLDVPRAIQDWFASTGGGGGGSGTGEGAAMTPGAISQMLLNDLTEKDVSELLNETAVKIEKINDVEEEGEIDDGDVLAEMMLVGDDDLQPRDGDDEDDNDGGGQGLFVVDKKGSTSGAKYTSTTKDKTKGLLGQRLEELLQEYSEEPQDQEEDSDEDEEDDDGKSNKEGGDEEGDEEVDEDGDA